MADAVIREYYGDEAKCYYELAVPSFHVPDPTLLIPGGDPEKGWRKTEEKHTSVEVNGVKYCRLGAFADGRLAANVDSTPILCRFDGHSVLTGHVGAVCSEAELRRGGLVRRLMAELTNRQYDDGLVLSHLEPFIANFYRKFGYEIAMQRIQWTIFTEFLPSYSNEGIRRYMGTEEQKAEIVRIWRTFSAGCNLADDPTSAMWEDWFRRHEPYGENYYGYLHYTGGEADGFFCYSLDHNEPSDLVLDMTEGAFWYTSDEGLLGMLRFMRGFYDYARTVKLCLPEQEDITPYIEYTGGWSRKVLERRIWVRGTTRVVNVKRALELAAYKGSGHVSIRVDDPACERNCGTFTVDFADGKAVSVREGGEADIALSVGAFSVMLLGRGGLGIASRFSGTEIYGNRENLEKVFYPKPVYYTRMG